MHYLPRSLFTFVVLGLIFQSCILQSPDENFKVINPTANAPVQVDYNTGGSSDYHAVDTIWMNDFILIKSYASRIHECNLTINGQAVDVVQTDPGFFTLERGDLAPGNYAMTLTYNLGTNTKSVSDQLGTEFTTVAYHFVLSVLDDNYVPEITSVKIADGTVKITFNPYLGKNFKSYTINKRTDSENVSYKSYTILNSHQNSLIDSTFVGGNVYYTLVLNNGAEKTSEPFYLHYSFYPTVELLPIDETHLGLSWPRSALYANVATYDVTFGTKTYTGLTDDHREIEIDGPGFFEQMYTANIVQHSRSDSEDFSEQALAYEIRIFLGKKIRAFSHMIHDPVEPFYYAFSGSSPVSEMLYKINDETFEVIDSIAMPFSNTTPYGKVLISPNGLYHYVIGYRQIMRFDPTSMEVLYKDFISNLPINAETAADALYFSENSFTAVDNNNHIMFRGQQTSKLYIVDMTSLSKVFEISFFPSLTIAGHLSNDGKFLVMQQYLYQWTGSTYAFAKEFSYSDIVYEQFINSDPNKLLIVSKGAVIVFDCETRSEISNTPVSSVYNCNLDQVTKKVCLESVSSYATIFDLATLTFTQVPAYWNYPMSLQGGAFLFSNNAGPPYGAYALKLY